MSLEQDDFEAALNASAPQDQSDLATDVDATQISAQNSNDGSSAVLPASTESAAELNAGAEILENESATEASSTDASEGSEESEEPDELVEFRKSLATAAGDWYVIHSYAGYEKRVKSNLQNRISSLNMEEFIYQIEVPEEEYVEIKNGVKKVLKRNVYPGYVLVRLDLTDESWSCVRNTPGVTGFVGNAHNPYPLTLTEVENILAPRPQEAS